MLNRGISIHLSQGQFFLYPGKRGGGGLGFTALVFNFPMPPGGFKKSSVAMDKMTESRYTTTDTLSGLLLIVRDLG